MKQGVRYVFLPMGISTVLHFLVDGLCVCCLFLLAGEADLFQLLGVFMVYNVLAFLTQPLTGMLADLVRQRHLLLMASVALQALGVAVATLLYAHFSLFVAYVAVSLLGMGNSLFHVWGGKEVALSTGNDVCALGVFVSTGAFGLAVGMLLHAWWLLYVFLLLIAVLAVVAVRMPVAEPLPVHPGKSWLAWLAVLLLMAFVVFRSFLGETFAKDVAKGGLMVLAIGGIAMLGKAGGGCLARRIGLGAVFILALAGSVACVLLKGSMAWLWLPGLLLINGTMAVTLRWANFVMPGHEGLAFGLLAAALMPGYLLAQVPDGSVTAVLLTLVPTIVLELLVLWSLREKRADVLWSSVVVNILTNVPLNLYVTYVSDSVATVLTAEVLIVAVEALWYRYFVDSWRRAVVYSVLCNGISFLTGLLVQLLWILFT